jgi:hypothetical protein
MWNTLPAFAGVIGEALGDVELLQPAIAKMKSETNTNLDMIVTKRVNGDTGE